MVLLGQLQEGVCVIADLLEEAMIRQSGLREKYEYQLKLWRRGIVI